MLTCLDFLIIPVAFYVIVAAASLNLDNLRKEGWLFESAQGTGEKWYEFYSYYGEYTARLSTLFMGAHTHAPWRPELDQVDPTMEYTVYPICVVRILGAGRSLFIYLHLK